MNPEDRIRDLLRNIARTGRDSYGLAGMSANEIASRTMENPPAEMPSDIDDLSRAAADELNRRSRAKAFGVAASRPR